MDDGHARVKMDEVRTHLERTWFAWVGGEPGSVFYFRIHSPVVLIEFDHQRPVDLRHLPDPKRHPQHIHVVVRTPNGNDYGKDLLRQHYESTRIRRPLEDRAAEAARARLLGSTRRFTSSIQFCTTTRLVGLPLSRFLMNKNRRPSRDTSVRTAAGGRVKVIAFQDQNGRAIRPHRPGQALRAPQRVLVRQEEQLIALRRPKRRSSPSRRDLPLSRLDVGEWPDIDL